MAKPKQLPSKEYLNILFTYDPKTGVLAWKVRPVSHFTTEAICKMWNTQNSNKEAGSLCKSDGYIRVTLDRSIYKAHRLIFKMLGKPIDGAQVDHVNHIKTDNRWSNLRLVTQTENGRNRPLNKGSTSGHTGVTWCKKTSKWMAHIKVNNKHIALGYHTDINDAITAREMANIKYNFHTNHGAELGKRIC